jgi:hypothetical protein
MAFAFLRFSFFLVAIISATANCSRPAELPAPSEFRIGATRAEILEAFGPPFREQTFYKTGDAIWGSIEEFWPQVSAGSTVEVWSYLVQAGTLELYFIDSSPHVQGKGLAPTGAVFEGEG